MSLEATADSKRSPKSSTHESKVDIFCALCLFDSTRGLHTTAASNEMNRLPHHVACVMFASRRQNITLREAFVRSVHLCN